MHSLKAVKDHPHPIFWTIFFCQQPNQMREFYSYDSFVAYIQHSKQGVVIDDSAYSWLLKCIYILFGVLIFLLLKSGSMLLGDVMVVFNVVFYTRGKSILLFLHNCNLSHKRWKPHMPWIILSIKFDYKKSFFRQTSKFSLIRNVRWLIAFYMFFIPFLEPHIIFLLLRMKHRITLHDEVLVF